MSHTDALAELHAAIQTFSNALADSTDQSGIVGHAVIAWEESSFDEDGDLRRQILYAASGDAASPAATMGLASLLLEQLRADIVSPRSCCCEDEE